jgi:nitrate reductase NapD
VDKELHIAGIVVHARPERVQRVAEAIRGLSGADIHATSADGKLVVTLEAPSAREIAARMDEIQQLDAVLSASLVYQHNESLEAMMEEVSHGNDETGIH